MFDDWQIFIRTGRKQVNDKEGMEITIVLVTEMDITYMRSNLYT